MSANKGKCTSILAFGNSMTDNGFNNGHGFQHYSNGPVWVEYLAKLLGISSVDNRAWGGALSGIGNYHQEATDWSGLRWQIAQLKSTIAPDTLVTIEIGINDLHDLNLGITPEDVVGNISDSIKSIIESGAENVLIWNLPISIIPPGYTDQNYAAYEYFHPQLETVEKLVLNANQLLQSEIDKLKLDHEKCKLLLFDCDQALAEISTRFEYMDSVWQGSYQYPTAGKWIWWDHWHFMTECHAYIADHVAKLIRSSE